MLTNKHLSHQFTRLSMVFTF